jgi:hypothetical protein
MKRNISIAVFLSIIAAMLSGCDLVKLPSVTAPLTGEELYRRIDYLISSPDSQDGSSGIDGEFTFSAYLAGEPFEQTFTDDDNTYIYQEAYISRSDDYFFVNVTAIAEAERVFDTYVRVTGTLDGTVYWTEDGSREDVLDINASKLEPFTVSEAEPDYGPTITVSTGSGAGEYTFTGAHYSEAPIEPVIVLYFEYKNTGTAEESPEPGLFAYYHGEESVSKRSFEPYEFYGGALEAYIIPDGTFAGKTQLYYIPISVSPEAYDNTLWVSVWDDDFALIYDIGIDIAENLDALNAPAA